MTRVALGLLDENLLLLLLGHAVLHGLGLARRPREHLRLVGLAYLTGWALLGVALSLALMAGIPAGLTTSIVLVAVLVVVSALVTTRVPAPVEEPVVRRRSPVAAAAAGLAGAIVVVEGIAALVLPLKNDWDPFLDLLTAWLPRAQTIYYSHSLDAPVWNSFVTPWYPPLIPAAYAQTSFFVGGFHPSVLAFQQTILGLAFVVAVAGVLDRYAPRWLTFPSLALLLSTPWFWWRLSSLLPDQPVAYLLVLAAIGCVIWLRDGRVAWLALAAVFLAAATLTKLEGGIFGGLLVLAVVVAGFASRRRAALPALALLLGPAAILPWRLWLSRNALATSTPDYNVPNLLDPGFLLDRVHRFTYAIRYLLDAPFGHFGPEIQTALLVCLALAAAAAAVFRIPGIVLTVSAWLVLSFLALAVIYWTSRVDLHFYVSTSASRVGTTLIIAGAVLTPLLLGLALRRPAPDDYTRSSSDSTVSRSPSSRSTRGS
jgi:hypothetical protein